MDGAAQSLLIVIATSIGNDTQLAAQFLVVDARVYLNLSIATPSKRAILARSIRRTSSVRNSRRKVNPVPYFYELDRLSSAPVDPDSLLRNYINGFNNVTQVQHGALLNGLAVRIITPLEPNDAGEVPFSRRRRRTKAIPILDNDPPAPLPSSIFNDSFLRSQFRPALISPSSERPPTTTATSATPARTTTTRENRAEISGGRAQVRAAGRGGA